MQVYLIRHGMTAGNLERRYVGKTDESILDDSRKRLELYEGPGDGRVVFVSPLKRCIESAELLYPSARQVIVPEFAECDFGDFEYMNYTELNGNCDYQKFIDSGGECGFPNGESRSEFVKRCVSGFKRICDMRYMGDMIMVVHGGTIMALLSEYAVPHKDYFAWQIGNEQGYKAELVKTACGYKLKNVERAM